MDTINLTNLARDCGSEPTLHKGGHATRLRIPDRRRRFIVWGKAAGLSTYRIRRTLGFACHRNTIRRHANRGLKEIAAALNGEQPPASRVR